eukprot:TRINITY_DN1520_c0_g1_i1.p1 TRINITY_DN1520_c0_g1~~TRINITY_DN1520_c0_g1_i1.p1  ORF type:complete len:116 (-),score=24.11 TRINITY_DN1520_c0_g1_i1:56-403(-)
MATPAIATTKFQSFLNHPAGPKTIHFWAPAFKWALVFAGLKDLSRPPEKISTAQSSALALTGLIWMRYATQITPINYSLGTVNAFVAMTGCYQLYRKFTAPPTQPQEPPRPSPGL